MEKKVVINLHKLIEKRNISMRELSRMADVRPEALNELANQQRKSINFGHIVRLAESAVIDDIREIIDLVDMDE